MELLDSIMSRELLNAHIANGIVRRQTHPEYPELAIYVYTEQAAFGRIWDEVTNQCRGTITISLADGEFVFARGFDKFHNLNTSYIPETLVENLPDEQPVVTTKEDGSMGIIFEYAGLLHVATKGSFASDQAKWATKFLRENHSNISIPPGMTPICEVIYPDNRIVVDYKGAKKLVLLSMVYNKNAREMGRQYLEQVAKNWNFPLVKKFDKTLAECSLENIKNQEGYVLTYSTGLKVKVKFEEYCRLHRVVTGLNPRAVWEFMSTGQTKEVWNWINDNTLPTEFREWLAHIRSELHTRYRAEAHKAYNGWAEFMKVMAQYGLDIYNPADRKEVSRIAKQGQSWGMIFAMLDGKPIEPLFWEAIYPAGADTFRKDGE